VRSIAAAAIVTVALIAGCAPAATAPGVSATPPSSPSAASSVSPASASPPSASPATSTSMSEPTSGLAPFDCGATAQLPATTSRAQISDVRVGSHGSGETGYDRIVFEFQGSGVPDFTLKQGSPPFTKDPSGLPLNVQGSRFLVIVMHGGTGVTPEGQVTYSGPTDFKPGFPALTELIQAGDFEAVSEWVVGMNGPSCHRLFVLTNPTRVVIDLQHTT